EGAASGYSSGIAMRCQMMVDEQSFGSNERPTVFRHEDRAALVTGKRNTKIANRPEPSRNNVLGSGVAVGGLIDGDWNVNPSSETNVKKGIGCPVESSTSIEVMSKESPAKRDAIEGVSR